MTCMHRPGGLVPNTAYRADTDEATDTPAYIWNEESEVNGSIVWADARGVSTIFISESEHLWMKPVEGGDTVESFAYPYPEYGIMIWRGAMDCITKQSSLPAGIFTQKNWFDTGVTDSDGLVTFDIPTRHFASVVHVSPSPVEDSDTPLAAHVRTQTATQVVIQITSGPDPAPAGITVNVQIIGN